ncbi:MAG: hypothetical protein H6566_08990 [Lewinellaceae bacterium]|nr:hypothetical protein [Lewinellaceae bacterium]
MDFRQSRQAAALMLLAVLLVLCSFRREAVEQSFLPKAVRRGIALYFIAVVLVLTPIWLMLMMGDVEKRAPGDTYAVFLLDLCIVFPAFAIISAMLLRNRPYGNLLSGVALVKGATICLSVGFGEWFVAFRGGFPPNYGMLGLFGGLGVVSLALLLGYWKGVRIEG